MRGQAGRLWRLNDRFWDEEGEGWERVRDAGDYFMESETALAKIDAGARTFRDSYSRRIEMIGPEDARKLLREMATVDLRVKDGL